MDGGYIYIMTNKYKTTLYIGVTNNLKRHVWEHRTHYDTSSFTAKYNLEYCVYYEYFEKIGDAISREKELKKWRREKKNALIASNNPAWRDYWEEIQDWIY